MRLGGESDNGVKWENGTPPVNRWKFGRQIKIKQIMSLLKDMNFKYTDWK